MPVLECDVVADAYRCQRECASAHDTCALYRGMTDSARCPIHDQRVGWRPRTLTLIPPQLRTSCGPPQTNVASPSPFAQYDGFEGHVIEAVHHGARPSTTSFSSSTIDAGILMLRANFMRPASSKNIFMRNIASIDSMQRWLNRAGKSGDWFS